MHSSYVIMQVWERDTRGLTLACMFLTHRYGAISLSLSDVERGGKSQYVLAEATVKNSQYDK